MEFRAVSKFVRISPRRARLVADNVRGIPVGEALDKLALMPQKAAGIIRKTIDSAVANAESYTPEEKGEKPDIDTLFVKELFIDEGPTLKRISYRAYGRANRKRRRSSHVTVVLDEMVLSEDEKTAVNRAVRKHRGKKGEKTKTAGKKKGVKNWLQDRRSSRKQGDTKEGAKHGSAVKKTVPSE